MDSVNRAVRFRQMSSAIGELYHAGRRSAANFLDGNVGTAGPVHLFASFGDRDPSVPTPDDEKEREICCPERSLQY